MFIQLDLNSNLNDINGLSTIAATTTTTQTCTKKRKMEGEKSSVIMEEEDLKPSDKEAGIEDCVSPRKESATPCGGHELNATEDVQDSTKG
nr:hypothetical protein CFP56_79505 [Quercus suber]